MTTVFLDTVGLVALWDADDQWHEPCQQAFVEIIRQADRLVTTTFVLLECGNALSRTPFRKELDEFRDQLERADKLIHPVAEDWRAAWQAYARGEADAAGIVDQVSFVIMRRLGLVKAFTNDRHFRAAGFELLF